MEPDLYDLNSGWINTDLEQAAKDDDKPKLKQSEYDERIDMVYDDAVVKFREEFLDKWESQKKYAVLLDCSSTKPYSVSPAHTKVISEIQNNDLQDEVQQYICSEPLGLCPREWETYYPAYAYNLVLEPGMDGYDAMIPVFEKGFNKIKDSHEYWITFMPSNKTGMVKKALPEEISTVDIPYGLYQDPPISDMVDDFEEKGECTIFDHEGNWSMTGT